MVIELQIRTKPSLNANIPETYTLKAMFKYVSEEENIRNGPMSILDLCQYLGHK